MAGAEHGRGCALRLRERGERDGWTSWQTVRVIEAHCGVRRLKANRLARGWTVPEAVARLAALCESEGLGQVGLTRQQLSHWENGRGKPGERYLDLLCRLYATRADRLGFGADYTPPGQADPHGCGEIRLDAWPQSAGVPVRSAGTALPPAVLAGPDAYLPDGCQTLDEAVSAPPAGYGAAGDSAARRTLLHYMAVGSGALTGPLLGAVDATRREMDATLATTGVTQGRLYELEEAAARYAQQFGAAAPVPMLCSLVLDFGEVQRLAAQRQPADTQRRLCRVAVTLATLVADELMKLGAVRSAHAWFVTAKDAAEETGEPGLLAWTGVGEGMLTYHYGDPGRAADLARRAQAVARRAGPPFAAAAALEARAWARLGNAEGAHAALRRAHEAYERLDDAGRADVCYQGFPERRLRFYCGSALSQLGEAARAWTEQRQALALYPRGALDPALIHLDRATALARGNEVVEACRLTGEALLGLPAEHRTEIVLARARDVMAAIPPQRRRLSAVRELRDLLAAGLRDT